MELIGSRRNTKCPFNVSWDLVIVVLVHIYLLISICALQKGSVTLEILEVDSMSHFSFKLCHVVIKKQLRVQPCLQAMSWKMKECAFTPSARIPNSRRCSFVLFTDTLMSAVSSSSETFIPHAANYPPPPTPTPNTKKGSVQ